MSRKKPAQKKTKKASGPGKVGDETPSFEEALERLEALVERLEGGEIPLEESLAAYAEGTGLVKQCMERLKQAETLIRELHQDAEGFTLEPSSLDSGEDEDDDDEAGQDEFRF